MRSVLILKDDGAGVVPILVLMLNLDEDKVLVAGRNVPFPLRCSLV